MHACRSTLEDPTLLDQRNFFLYKGPLLPPDSRRKEGLTASILVPAARLQAAAGRPIPVRAAVTNDGGSVWLPKSAGTGAVYLGCHVLGADGAMLEHDHAWLELTPGGGRPIAPGETVEVASEVPPLPAGRYTLELDLVSDGICWFARNGSPAARVSLTVR